MGWKDRVFGRRGTHPDARSDCAELAGRPKWPNEPSLREDPSVNVRVRLMPPGSEAGTSRSYLGGRPALPPGMEWPRGPGGPCAFIGQIAMDEVPAELWGGIGPRHGRLLLFEDTTPRFAIRAIHCPADGSEREFPGPLWEHSGFAKNPPLRISVRLDPYAPSLQEDRLPDPDAAVAEADDWSWLPILSMDVFPDGQKRPRYDFGILLELPEYRPVDWASFQILVSAMLDYARKMVSTRGGAGRQEDGAWAEARKLTQAKAEEFVGELEAWHDRISRLEASAEAFADHADMLLRKARKSAYGFYTVEPSGKVALRETPIFSGREKPAWLGRYAEQLSAYFLTRAAAHPGQAAASQHSFSASWLATAARETGRMGIMPVPFADGDGLEPASGDTRVLLIGLPRSRLLGWNWGGGYGLAVAIERADLDAGHFDKVIGRFIEY